MKKSLTKEDLKNMISQTEHKLTGFPHIDKMWMEKYDISLIDNKLPSKTIYQYMKEKSLPAKYNTAITYYGKKISYDELYHKIELSSKIFSELGVKVRNRIMFLMPNIPETAYTFYGSTEIGAVADYIDPRPESVDMKTSANKVLAMIKKEKVDYIVALDQCYVGLIKPIEDELKDFGIKNIIVVSANDSMETIHTMNYLMEVGQFEGLKKLRTKIKKSKVIDKMTEEAVKSAKIETLYYRDLARECSNIYLPERIYKPNELAVIVHSAGTTSLTPKPIPLTHDNLNAYIQQSFVSNMPVQCGDRALHMLPYYAAYGLVNVTHSGLCHGNNLIQVPEFSIANLGKLMKKYRPQTIIGTPTWFLSLLKDKSLSKEDLSYLTMITYGGDSMEVEDELRVNEFLKSHNAKTVLTKGHGMSETAGCASFAVRDYNKPGTLGIPLANTIYAIVDPETKEMKKFEDGQEYLEGELIISTKAATSGVLDGVEYVKHKTYDGIDFIVTNDIARMDRKGVMTFLSRSDRSFTRYDGYKLKPFELENMIKSYNHIKYCVISPYYDEARIGNMPLVNIVLEDGIEMTNEERVAFVKQMVDDLFVKNVNVSSRQVPSRVRIRQKLPITKNGKIDYKILEYEKMDGTEIHIDMEETNISIGDIKIYIPVNNQLSVNEKEKSEPTNKVKSL